MAGGKPYIPLDDDALRSEYLTSDISMSALASRLGVSYSTVRRRFFLMGIIRDRIQAGAIAGPKIGAALTGIKRNFNEAQLLHAANLHKARKSFQNPKQFRINTNGYRECTYGENMGRLEHRMIMEAELGRTLSKSEVVHHKDHNKLNNDPSNLQLMTLSTHAALHRAYEKQQKKEKL